MWSKKGKNYTVEATDSQTVFNLDGLVVKQGQMSQKEAVAFLEMNGYQGFQADIKKVEDKAEKKSAYKSKAKEGEVIGEKINGKVKDSLKEELKD
jgi:hypothetical protein